MLLRNRKLYRRTTQGGIDQREVETDAGKQHSRARAEQLERTAANNIERDHGHADRGGDQHARQLEGKKHGTEKDKEGKNHRALVVITWLIGIKAIPSNKLQTPAD